MRFLQLSTISCPQVLKVYNCQRVQLSQKVVWEWLRYAFPRIVAHFSSLRELSGSGCIMRFLQLSTISALLEGCLELIALCVSYNCQRFQLSQRVVWKWLHSAFPTTVDDFMPSGLESVQLSTKHISQRVVWRRLHYTKPTTVDDFSSPQRVV